MLFRSADPAGCAFEPGFPATDDDDDAPWSAAAAAETPETPEQHRARKQALLEDIFARDPAEFVALTTHSYAVTALLAALGEPDFRLGEGAMVALLVKGRRRPATPGMPTTPEPEKVTAPTTPESSSLKSEHTTPSLTLFNPARRAACANASAGRTCPKSKTLVTNQAMKGGGLAGWVGY